MVPTQNSSAATDVAVSNHESSRSSVPVHFVLEVTKGRTRFRRRPVTTARFLIGAGSTCDLRLGGERMPALHSIITIAGGEVALEAIAAEPHLMLNGRLVQTAKLCDGDVISVGDVQLLAHLEAGHTPARVQARSVSADMQVEATSAVSELSATELIDLIEAEERQVEEFEQKQRVGANALVQAIMGRVRPVEGAPPAQGGRAPNPAPHFLSKRPQILAAQTRPSPHLSDREETLQQDLEELGKQLASLSQEMKGNSLRAVERDAHYTTAADVLLDTQQKLVSQLELLLDQVQVLKSHESTQQKPRAIA